jgi:hypothetical protein
MFDNFLDPLGIGSKVGDMAGKLFGTDNNAQIDSAQSTMNDVLGQANATADRNQAILDQYLDEMRGIYGAGSAKYGDAVQRLSDAIGTGPDTFTATGTVNDFYDPYANQRRQQAMNAIEASGAAGGNRFSSRYLDRVAQKQQALASEEWQKAFDRWQNDRSRQLQEWQAGQSAKQTYLGNLGTVASLYGNDRTQLANALGDYYSNQANQNNANLEVYSDVAQTNANLDAQRKGGIGSLIGPAAQLAGALF